MPTPALTLLAPEASHPISVFGWIFYPILCIAVVLALYCLFTIHRQPHFTEVQKLKWVLFTLFLPILGPMAYWLRLRSDRQEFPAQPSKSDHDPRDLK